MEEVVADTNILVRLIVNDHPLQVRKARKLFESSKVIILESVLLELEWVLRGVYSLSREEIARAFHVLLRQRNVRSDRMALLLKLVSDYEQGFDFGDALHHTGAEGVELATFDRKFVNRAKGAGWLVRLPQ